MHFEKSIGIIGGGILSIDLSFRLSKLGYQVTIMEQSDQAGGLLKSIKLGGFTCDKFYHVILPDDRYTLGFIRELGLEKEIRWTATKTGFFVDGSFHSLSNVLEFLRFPALNLFDKFRLGLTIFIGAYFSDLNKLDRISAEEWLIRWSGITTFNRIWLPLLKAKLGENYNDASAAFIVATIKRLYGARKSSTKKEVMGFMKGGYSKILKKINEKITDNKITILTSFQACHISRGDKNNMVVKSKDNRSLMFDYVISTLPSPSNAIICEELSASELENLSACKYMGVICASLLLKNPLTPYYISNLACEGVNLTGIIEFTALDCMSDFGGNSLIYLPFYVQSDDPMFNYSEDQILEQFTCALKKIHPSFTETEIIDSHIARARFVMTAPRKNYYTGIAGPVTSLDRFFILNSSLITEGVLNVNETLKVAEKYFPVIANIIRHE